MKSKTKNMQETLGWHITVRTTYANRTSAKVRETTSPQLATKAVQSRSDPSVLSCHTMRPARLESN